MGQEAGGLCGNLDQNPDGAGTLPVQGEEDRKGVAPWVDLRR